MTIFTTVRYQGSALTDTFNANRVQCLTLLVHYKYKRLIQQLVRSLEIRVKNTNYKNKQKIRNKQIIKDVSCDYFIVEL